MVVFVVILFIIIAWINLPGLIKAGNKMGTAVFCLLFTLTLTVSILVSVGVKVPSPMDEIGNFFMDRLHMGYPPTS